MPIETPSKIKLISDALVLLGEKPASSLTEDRYGVTVGANLFEAIYENELDNNGTGWHFANKKRALSRLTDVPLNQYQYAYQIPTDCLLPLGAYPSTDYEIYGSHIYTNATAIDLEYRFKPEITALPAYFSMLLRYALARDMIKPITESDNGVSIMEAKYNKQLSRAQFADAQGRPNKVVRHNPFVQVRG